MRGVITSSNSKKGQIWIETVVYTLIALVIIGTVLTFARPRIEALQDRSAIEQSIQILENIDTIILDIKDIPGNKRELEIGMKKGSLKIDAENDQLIYEIESRDEYSEPGVPYKKGDITILNNQVGKINTITLTLDYASKYNLKWNSADSLKLVTKSQTAYTLFISNEGEENGRPQINFEFK